VQLWVASDGPETEELRRRFPPSDRLTWLGVVSDEEAASRLAGADIVCAPSLGGESFGVILLEAMAARCTVVASDIDVYRDAAADHATLVPPGDPAALGQALEAVVAEVAGRVGRAGPAALAAASTHAEHWSMNALAEAYETRYLRATGSGTGAADR
jgi:phosphatidylinositol alpha-mannosyltransferase